MHSYSSCMELEVFNRVIAQQLQYLSKHRQEFNWVSRVCDLQAVLFNEVNSFVETLYMNMQQLSLVVSITVWASVSKFVVIAPTFQLFENELFLTQFPQPFQINVYVTSQHISVSMLLRRNSMKRTKMIDTTTVHQNRVSL